MNCAGRIFSIANSWRTDLHRILADLAHDDGPDAGRRLARGPRESSPQPRSARAREQIGRVEEVGDGIALISGLPDARLDELLHFDKGQFGFAQTLDATAIGCVLLDDVDAIEAGDSVRGTGDVVRVPVGPHCSAASSIRSAVRSTAKARSRPAAHEPIERPAPAIIDRDLVTQPVQTGLVVVDALFALGRGQRELIIGDRAIGKTTIAIDTIINQKNSDIICVYVAVGQKTLERAPRHRRDPGGRSAGALHLVVAGAASSPGLQWIAPFAGFTMAEYFRDRGQHALIVIDDLTKHAATHREIALLTRQSPGREAYPGDIFYVHARLLERAAKLSKEKGGGSLTALPIAETDAGNLSAYIPTNLISITDGQIVLDSQALLRRAEAGGRRRRQRQPRRRQDAGARLARRGARPCGSTTRNSSSWKCSPASAACRTRGCAQQLTRGARIRAILNQPQHAPLRLADEVALVLAVQSGLLDPLARWPRCRRSAHGLADALDRGVPDAVRAIQETRRARDALKETLLRGAANITPRPSRRAAPSTAAT